MNKLDALSTGFAAAITFAVVYAVCALVFALFPDATLGFFDAWFHGLDLRLLVPPGGMALTTGTFFYGLVGVSLTAFITGVVFAVVNNFLKR